MKKTNVIRLADKAPKRPAESPIGEGLSPGRILAVREGVVEVELFGGGVVDATPADEVEPGFLAECLRGRRTVLVTGTPSGVLLLGALQTASQVAAVGTDTHIHAERFVVEASKALVLRVGQTELSLDPRGVVRFAGEKMSVAVAKVFRVLAASAELP